MRYYPPKRDWFVAGNFLFAVMLLLGIFIHFYVTDTLMATSEVVIFLLAAVPVVILLGWLWFGTHYRMDSKTLYVRCGPVNKSYPLADIRYVKVGRSIQGGYALSLHRLHIGIQNGRAVDELIVAPADFKRFTDDLRRLRPDVVIEGV
ncbi:MAG: PH domain-containing protein [Pseudomonadota bacterium]